MTRQNQDSGFSLIEMMIVIAAMLPLLAGILGTTRVVTDAVDTHNRSAGVTTHLRTTLRRISDFVRPAKMSTIQVQAVAIDVTELRAVSIGQWIPPTDLIWRSGLEFQAASGLLSMNAKLSTAPRRLTFELEPGELDNDIDDDGDGLIDEGSVRLLHDTATVAMIRGVERCEFALDGRLLQVRVAVARRDDKGRVYRGLQVQSFYMRNN